MSRPVLMFDFDGVLIDSIQAGFALLRMNYPDMTFEQFRALSLENMYDGIQKYEMSLPENHHFSKNDYAQQYTELIKNHTLHAGMKSILENVYVDHDLVIVSSANSKPIQTVLQREQVDSFFIKILGSDVARSKVEKIAMVCETQNINPAQALFITDSVGDVHEAHRAGVAVIAVTWGVHTAEELHTAAPHAVVEQPADLPQTIRNFFAATTL